MKRIHFTRKTLLLALLITVVLAGGGVLAYNRVQDDDQPVKTPETTPSVSQAERDAAERQETEQRKEQTAKNEQQPAPQPGQKKQVSVVITNASAQAVNAYVSGVFEEGGVCTATFTKDGQTVTKTSQGFQNVSTTNCAPVNLTRSDFPSAGTWSLTVRYSSATAEGNSAARNVEVQ